ncbi:MAG: hypothetical protein ACOX74_02930 [Lachnospiraceae bacterium]|jgi:hypothetical protein
MKNGILLKVMGFIMFILGAVTMLVGAYSLAATIRTSAGPFYVFSAVLILASAATQLFGGYLGVAYSGYTAARHHCVPIAVIVIVLNLIAAFLSSRVSEAFSIASILQGLAVPALYLLGAWFSGRS